MGRGPPDLQRGGSWAASDEYKRQAMSATVEAHTYPVWFVPEEAVMRIGIGQAVFTANADGSCTMVPVTTGAEEYGYIELTNNPAQLRQRQLVVNLPLIHISEPTRPY